MGLRKNEPGWVLAAMHDPAKRRGIWFRYARFPHVKGRDTLEACGGREGDDGYVKLVAGQVLTDEHLHALSEIFDMSRWNMELEKEARLDAASEGCSDCEAAQAYCPKHAPEELGPACDKEEGERRVARAKELTKEYMRPKGGKS